MWGGENGICTQRWLLFVIFQTKNCWEMLKLVRHGDRTCLIWDGALCIDQQTYIESDEHVTNELHLLNCCIPYCKGMF